MPYSNKRYFNSTSTWLVIGMSIVLTFIVIGLAFMNHNREKQFMVEFLNDKGASLIRAFEAGARTGMMGAFGTLPRLETLIQETAIQPDILYIAIVDSNGEVIAHSEPDQVGVTFLEQNAMRDLKAGKEVKWRTVTDTSSPAFEVYKLFLPVLPSRVQSHMMQMMQNQGKMMHNKMRALHGSEWTKGLQTEKLLHPDNRPVIVIGMDMTAFNDAMAEDVKLMVIISGVIVLLGVAGVVSLFWAQSYTRSTKLLSNISAISSEMINNLPEGIVLTDNSLKIHYMNEIAADLLGANVNKALGCHSEKILPPAVNSVQVAKDTNGGVIETELILFNSNRQEIPVSVIATEVVTTDGIFVGLMYLIKDLTQIKQLQAEIQRKDYSWM